MRRKPFKSLDINLLDQVVADSPRPSGGWVKAVREALGMTRAQLGKRVGISQHTVATLERNEANNSITLESLQKLAAGMGGRVVYSIVPERGQTFEDIVRQQALAVANRRLARVSHTMALEQQEVSDKLKKDQLQRIVDSLLSGSRRQLWR